MAKSDTEKQEVELSPFLQNQERIMQARASQDRDIAERQKCTLTPAVQESSPAQGTYQVDTFDATNNKVATRTIQPLPTPQRIQAKPVISKVELTNMIAELRDEMATQQDRFNNKDAIDKERTDKRQELSAKVAELTAQLRVAESELENLNREGSVRDGWIEFAKRAEQRIVSIATGVYSYLLEKISNERHEASYKELTSLLKESVRFKVDRSGIRGLTQASFSRLHATPKDQISNARIEATLEKVFSATETLEKVLEK
jgi:hypothetical protein